MGTEFFLSLTACAPCWTSTAGPTKLIPILQGDQHEYTICRRYHDLHRHRLGISGLGVRRGHLLFHFTLEPKGKYVIKGL